MDKEITDSVHANGALINNNINGDISSTDKVSTTSSDGYSAIVPRSRISSFKLMGRGGRKKSKSSSQGSDQSGDDLSMVVANGKIKSSKRWNTIVTIVLVEAKNLLDPPLDGSSHNLYCKFRLGSESFKSKGVAITNQPEWRERFKFHLYDDHMLRLSLWDKGKQKNFMGSAVLDLALLDKERTHDFWQELDDGFGTVHFLVTMCTVRDKSSSFGYNFNEGVVKAKHAIHNLKSDWRLVGQLYVKVIGAKGLCGKPNAYCTLELDNERVQTPSARASSEPNWDKSYVFNVYDVTSTLDLKVYDSSLVTALRNDSLGRVSIPLLRINNGESRWVALKSRNNRTSAKGNCPRVQLEMTMFWNPVKATARLFRPKEVKYMKKPPKFDVALVYSNMQFVRETFKVLYDLNEQYKRLFEWEHKELSVIALVGWLLFWLYFRMWATPLLLLIPFFYFWVMQSKQQDYFLNSFNSNKDQSPDQSDNEKGEKGLTGKIQGLQEMTLTITGGVEYSVSLAERLYNLISFKVPFLSFLTMVFLVVAAAGFYYVPVNYAMMAFGIYKFSRGYLNPERVLNNDLLDFISRIPDNEILKDWKELSVPEPSELRRRSSTKRRTSDSSS